MKQKGLTSLAFYGEYHGIREAYRNIVKRDMSKTFRVTPKRTKLVNGTVLTPEMTVIVTTAQHTATPFYNGARELQDVYARLYAFDYRKACCSANDFEFISVN